MRSLKLKALGLVLIALAGVSVLSACDQLNRPMPVTSVGTSASSTGGAPSHADAGSDADLPSLPAPGDQPRVTPQPGDIQL